MGQGLSLQRALIERNQVGSPDEMFYFYKEDTLKTRNLLFKALLVCMMAFVVLGCNAVSLRQVPAATATPSLSIPSTSSSGAKPTTEPTPVLTSEPTPWKKYTSARRVDEIWDWTVIAGPSPRIETSFTNGDIVVWSEVSSSNEPLYETLWLGWEHPKFIHKTQVETLINNLVIGPDQKVYFTEHPSWIDRTGYRVYRYDPQTDDTQLIMASPYRGASEHDPHIAFRATLGGEYWIWPILNAEKGEECIQLYHFATGESRLVECMDAENFGFYEATLVWPWLYYTYQDDSGGDICHLARKVNLETGERQEWGGETCAIWEVVGNGAWEVWFEVPLRKDPNEAINYNKAEILGRDATGNVWDLGHGAAGSLVLCRDGAYWTYESGNAPGEIREWKGGDTVEVVYRSPNRDYGISSPRCWGNVLHIQRFNSGKVESPDEVLYTVLP